jgi:uncharacterized repeat protein (TIGR01451 family)
MPNSVPGVLSGGSVTAVISGLSPDTAYEFELVITDGSGVPISRGGVQTFTTASLLAPPSPPPPVVKDPGNPNADLGVSMAVDKSVAVIGDRLTYTITVRNSGPRGASAVTLTEVLPMQVGFQAVSSSQGGCTGGSSTVCTLGGMGDGVVVTVTLVGVVTSSGDATAGASVANVGQPDGNQGNQAASVLTRVALLSGVGADLVVSGPVVSGEPRPVNGSADLVVRVRPLQVVRSPQAPCRWRCRQRRCHP